MFSQIHAYAAMPPSLVWSWAERLTLRHDLRSVECPKRETQSNRRCVRSTPFAASLSSCGGTPYKSATSCRLLPFLLSRFRAFIRACLFSFTMLSPGLHQRALNRLAQPCTSADMLLSCFFSLFLSLSLRVCFCPFPVKPPFCPPHCAARDLHPSA